MPVNLARLRTTLQTFDWRTMFGEVLKWSRPTERPWSATVNGQSYRLTPVAQMADMHVYICTSDSGALPIQAIRRQIENQVKERRFEHIIIFEDGQRQEAAFQWIKRGQGAARSREFAYRRDQSGDLLLQRLSGIAFDFSDLDEQGRVDIVKVTARVAKQFDVEGVTRKFYEDFTRQRDAFQRFLQGIPIEADADQRWYVSVMLNRLMFIYFIQAKRFLDNDPEYLQTKLAWAKTNLGPDRFYRGFLRVLFFAGFAHEKNDRLTDTNGMLGDIPYLNGGLFLPHAIEDTYGDAIQIPDAAFEKLFTFFSSWRWHLNERPGLSEREIDPDVLGYIFEKYINQKQMGAYYTKEDITGYICRSTIIPALFDKANLSLQLLDLPKNIVAYLYPALKQTERLPTETDREYAARQERVRQLVANARDGTIATINDAITANLNLEAMIFDLVPFLDAQPLHRLYQALITLSLLDPTCGSGAFLFAAIKILKPIYEQVLDRMALLAERRKTDSLPFREILDAEQAHPNRDYFITKSIVVRNLYGVDIMEEATEICKLRLFLRLVADLEDAAHVEPLPDIDFNIRAGNALVGYASVEEIGGGYKGGIVALPKRVQQTVHEVETVQRDLSNYRSSQLQLNPSSDVFRRTREEIRTKIASLNNALDADMLNMGQIHREPNGGFNTQPFHWFTAFYEILSNGGFDVIVGNPPYVEYSKVKGNQKKDGEERYRIHGYKTESCGNLYAYVIERCSSILATNGRSGLIVQLSAICTDRMQPLQDLYIRSSGSLWTASFDDRPGKLFDGLEHIRAVIIINQKGSYNQNILATNLIRWYSESRDSLFSLINYNSTFGLNVSGSLPKIGDNLLEHIIKKLREMELTLKQTYSDNSSQVVYYYRSPLYWIRAMDFLPFFSSEGANRSVHHFKDFGLRKREHTSVVGCVINSSLFYMWFIVYGNGRNVAIRDITTLPIPRSLLDSTSNKGFSSLFVSLMDDYKRNSVMKQRKDGVQYQEFYPAKSKPIIDEIDRVLAQHYGFTDEELDFIINYDIKYRMGRAVDDAGDE